MACMQGPEVIDLHSGNLTNIGWKIPGCLGDRHRG